jgi:acetoacetate decarboxylase
VQGFSVPLSPEGRAGITPAPPWFYAGNFIVVNFEAQHSAVAAVLPPGLEVDPQDPGGCMIIFADYQYSSARDEAADPIGSQYNECIVLVNATYKQQPVSTCPHIYVDSDASMARGWIQGWPKKLGSVHTSRAFPLASPAAPQVGPGGRFAASLAVSDRRLAEATITLQRIAADPVILGSRPIINVRHFPRLSAGLQDRPAVHELVRSKLSNATRTDVWAGTASLSLFTAPDQELAALSPTTMRQSFRYSQAFQVDDLEVLEDIAH